MPGAHTGDDEVFPVVFPADHVHEFILGIAGERNANRLLPFHILAIGDFRVWAVEMSGAYGTCIALGF